MDDGLSLQETSMRINNTLKYLEDCLKKVELPWYATSNVPFYVDIKKPRPSLSKHDVRPTYWEYNDGCYMMSAVNEMPRILKYIRKLQRELRNYERYAGRLK